MITLMTKKTRVNKKSLIGISCSHTSEFFAIGIAHVNTITDHLILMIRSNNKYTKDMIHNA